MGISFLAPHSQFPIGDGSCTEGYWRHAEVLLPQLLCLIAEVAATDKLLPSDTPAFDVGSLFAYDAVLKTVTVNTQEVTRLLDCCQTISDHEDYAFFAVLVDALRDWTRGLK